MKLGSTLVAPRRASLIVSVCFAIAAAYSGSALAAESQALETVVVTAQRTEETLQEVPIAVTALSGAQMEDRQIIQFSDLQMNAPNVSFTPTNFGGSSMTIRGIGRLVISASGENGVSTHVNEVAMGTNLTAVEFFDVERVEILRGPQGTLFGRNATGGAINMVTKRPDFDAFGGFVDAEAGDYDHMRLKGALNVPVTDTFAIRGAGLYLDRDGYYDNVAYGQGSVSEDNEGELLTGIDDDVDGRSLYSYRLTAEWAPSDNSSLWVMYNKYNEDDDRARVKNQICKKNNLPTVGCQPDEFGFEGVHFGSTTGGVLAGLGLALPLGANDEATGLVYDYPRPENMDYRDTHTDFEPVYEYEEDMWLAGYEHNFENFTVGIIGGYQEADFLSQQDYNLNVGPNLDDLLEQGRTYPTSAPVGGQSQEWISPTCNYQDGTAGTFGGCIADVSERRVFAYDQATSDSEYWVIEAKVASQFDGPFNFLAGATTYETKVGADYYVFANTLDLYALYGLPLVWAPAFLGGGEPPWGGEPRYPGFFNSTGTPAESNKADGYAFFGELYYEFTDQLKLTVGLRYNKDNKQVEDSVPLYDAADVNFQTRTNPFDPTTGAFGTDPLWARVELAPFILQDLTLAELTALEAEVPKILEYWNATDAFLAAEGTAALSDARVAATQQVGLVPEPGERRFVTESPDDTSWDEFTGRIGLDWWLNDNTMVYGFYSRGYKPGGFNPPVSPVFGADVPLTYDQEEIDAIEIGTKNMLLDGTLMVNATAFAYDYQGLQVTRIVNNSSVNQNLDAKIWGLELESFWRPSMMPNLLVEFAYSYLDTEVDGATAIDPANKSAGDPQAADAEWLLFKNIDPGPLSGVLYVAPTEDALAATPDALAAFAAFSAQNGTAVPGTDYANGVPAYFSRGFLDAVCGGCTEDGLPVDLDGNQLPNSPENTIKIALAYTFNTSFGTITPRGAYYWQDDMYGREFNTRGDEIDSWDQHNASLIYESLDGAWMVKAWIRNIQDEDNITGHYLTSDTSGMFRNYQLTEPRIYGATVRYAFGAK